MYDNQNVLSSVHSDTHKHASPSSPCTVKCKLAENEVEVSGGGLNGTYSTIQFHFHWGNTEYHPGSEHMIDGERYPMEVGRCTGADIQCKQHASPLYILCAFLSPVLPYWFMLYFVDAHSQSEERSYCGAGQRGFGGNCCSWVFHKCTATLQISTPTKMTLLQNFSLLKRISQV